MPAPPAEAPKIEVTMAMTTFNRMVLPSGWIPIELELVLHGYLARVARDRSGGRWRWSVTKLEQAQRWKSRVVSQASARGYSKGMERALKMATVAIDALRKAEKET